LAALHGSQQCDGRTDFVQDRIKQIAVEMMVVHGHTPFQEKYMNSSCRGEKQFLSKPLFSLTAKAMPVCAGATRANLLMNLGKNASYQYKP